MSEHAAQYCYRWLNLIGDGEGSNGEAMSTRHRKNMDVEEGAEAERTRWLCIQ